MNMNIKKAKSDKDKKSIFSIFKKDGSESKLKEKKRGLNKQNQDRNTFKEVDETQNIGQFQNNFREDPYENEEMLRFIQNYDKRKSTDYEDSQDDKYFTDDAELDDIFEGMTDSSQSQIDDDFSLNSDFSNDFFKEDDIQDEFLNNDESELKEDIAQEEVLFDLNDFSNPTSDDFKDEEISFNDDILTDEFENSMDINIDENSLDDMSLYNDDLGISIDNSTNIDMSVQDNSMNVNNFYLDEDVKDETYIEDLNDISDFNLTNSSDNKDFSTDSQSIIDEFSYNDEENYNYSLNDEIEENFKNLKKNINISSQKVEVIDTSDEISEEIKRQNEIDEEKRRRIKENKKRKKERKKEKIRKYIEEAKRLEREAQMADSIKEVNFVKQENSDIEVEDIGKVSPKEVVIEDFEQIEEDDTQIKDTITTSQNSIETMDIDDNETKIKIEEDKNSNKVVKVEEVINSTQLPRVREIVKIEVIIKTQEVSSSDSYPVVSANRQVIKSYDNINQNLNISTVEESDYSNQKLNVGINTALNYYNKNDKERSLRFLKDIAICSYNNKEYMIAYLAIKEMFYGTGKKQQFVQILKEISIAKERQKREIGRLLDTINSEAMGEILERQRIELERFLDTIHSEIDRLI